MSDTQAPPAGNPQSHQSEIKLSCKHIWKVFGDDVAALFASDGSVDQSTIDSGAYINAVRDASFDVRGRNLCHHGFVRFGQIDAVTLYDATDRTQCR